MRCPSCRRALDREKAAAVEMIYERRFERLRSQFR